MIIDKTAGQQPDVLNKLQAQDAEKTQDSQARERAEKPAEKTPGGTESVQISNRALDVKKAHDALESIPAVREDKVQEMKQRIASGSFEVDSAALAEKILADALTGV